MNFKTQDYVAAINSYESWSKYHSNVNLGAVLRLLHEKNWIPSSVSVARAIRELGLARTDRKTSADDELEIQRKAEADERRQVEQFAAAPLTRDELEAFASFDLASLARFYYAAGVEGLRFRSRYDKAIREFGFRAPGRRPAADDGPAIELSVSDYHAIPAKVVAQRMLQDPPFRRAVNKLIEEGRI